MAVCSANVVLVLALALGLSRILNRMLSVSCTGGFSSMRKVTSPQTRPSAPSSPK